MEVMELDIHKAIKLIGTAVYYTDYNFIAEREIKLRAEIIGVNHKGVMVSCDFGVYSNRYMTFKFKDFNKDWFLTKEEAEQYAVIKKREKGE